MFLWVADVPYVIDDGTAPVMTAFINKSVCSSLPDVNSDPELYHLVLRLQTHFHSSYCMRKNSTCRFGFSKTSSDCTRLLNNIDLSAKSKGRFYVTKRNSDSLFINDYNPVVLRHWRATMDIQVIQNAEVAAYYVCSYLCKSERDDLKNAWVL